MFKIAFILLALMNLQVLAQKIAESSGQQCKKINDVTFYSSMLMKCDRCFTSKNQIAKLDNLGCKCADSQIRTGVADAKTPSSFLSLFTPLCKACGNDESPNRLGLKCIKCNDPTVQKHTDGQCICKSKGYILKDDGSKFSCEKCPDPIDSEKNKLFWRGPRNIPMYKCERCPGTGKIYDRSIQDDIGKIPQSCICGARVNNFYEAAEKCVPEADLDNTLVSAYSVEYTNGIRVTRSDTMVYYGLRAVIGCRKWKEIKSCQLLANLCVLNLYDPQNGFCKIHLELVKAGQQVNTFYRDPGYVQQLPWLYYLTKFYLPAPADSIVKKSNRVKFKASFTTENPDAGILKKLSFKFAHYNIEGDFLGFYDLIDQLFICEISENEVKKMMEIGTSIQRNCAFDISLLKKKLNWPRHTNTFFDVFLVDSDGTLIDVPVKMKDGNLYRRFFLYDTVSGISQTDGYKNGATPDHYRYAEEILLKISLDENEPEQIYLPYLQIKYTSKKAQELVGGLESRTAQVNFLIEYTMNTDGFWSFALTIFWILLSIAILVTLIFVYLMFTQESINSGSQAQGRGNQDEDNSEKLFKAIIIGIEKFTNILFWYMVGMSAWWFIFYKFQSQVAVFMPENPTKDEGSFQKNYRPYDEMLVTLTCFKLISLFYKIYFEQSTLDIFFIDWESPRMYQIGNGKPKEGVNPWRRLFIANEYNEMQSLRHINPDAILLFFMVCMEGFGMKYFSQQEVGFSTSKTNSPSDYILEFFMVFTVLFGITIFHYSIQMVTGFFWNPPPYLDFVDLCSVCNMSCIIFNEDLNGHYIHGKSPSGPADVSHLRLRLNLENESHGTANIRGVHNTPQYADQQTFELFMPKKMVQEYRQGFLADINTKIAKAQTFEQSYASTFKKAITQGPAIPRKFEYKESYLLQIMYNQIMKQYIDKVCSEPQAYIKQKTRKEKLLNMRDDNKEIAFPLMFQDSFFPSYSKCFLFGLEFDLCIMQMLVITSICRMSLIEANDIKSTLALGILIAYIVDCIFVHIRKYFGRRNLAVHALIDEKFLID